MDKADIEKFRRNAGQGITIDIGNDKFYFKPLPLRHLPELMDFARITQEEGEQALLKKENASRLFEILSIFVTNSYPDLAKEQDILDSFIIDNLEKLQGALVTTSTPKGQSVSDEKRALLDKALGKNVEHTNTP